jgi:hypothetical protein
MDKNADTDIACPIPKMKPNVKKYNFILVTNALDNRPTADIKLPIEPTFLAPKKYTKIMENIENID